MCIVICTLLLSRPARGAWVEMEAGGRKNAQTLGRAPQGARGLKSLLYMIDDVEKWSRPARGAWVEIFVMSSGFNIIAVAPRKGRVG